MAYGVKLEALIGVLGIWAFGVFGDLGIWGFGRLGFWVDDRKGSRVR